MARVTVTEIMKRDDGEIAALNTTQTAWNTQSGDIGAVNIAQEGIDRRNLAVEAVNDDKSALDYEEASAGTVANVLPTVVQIGGNEAEIGPFAIGTDADYELIIRCSFEHKCAEYHTFYLYASDDGPIGVGTFTVIYQSQRFYYGIDGIWVSGGMSVRETSTVATPIRWYALYADSSTGAVVTVQNVFFYAERILR